MSVCVSVCLFCSYSQLSPTSLTLDYRVRVNSVISQQPVSVHRGQRNTHVGSQGVVDSCVCRKNRQRGCQFCTFFFFFSRVWVPRNRMLFLPLPSLPPPPLPSGPPCLHHQPLPPFYYETSVLSLDITAFIDQALHDFTKYCAIALNG